MNSLANVVQFLQTSGWHQLVKLAVHHKKWHKALFDSGLSAVVHVWVTSYRGHDRFPETVLLLVLIGCHLCVTTTVLNS